MEIKLLEDDKKLILELLAEKYFGNKVEKGATKNIITLQKESVENRVFNNEEYFYKTGELCKEDRVKVIKLLFQDHFVNNPKCSTSHHIAGSEDNVSSHEFEVETTLINIIDNIKRPNVNEDERFNEPRTITNEDRDSIINMLNSFGKGNEIKDFNDTFASMPTRPNSKRNSQERDVKPAEKKSLEIEIIGQPEIDKQRIGNQFLLKIDDTCIRSTNYNNIFKNMNIKEISQEMEDIQSSVDNSVHHLDDAKAHFHTFFDKEQLKGSCKDFTPNIGQRSKISEDEETTSNGDFKKCVIEEKTFNVLMNKMPMNDITSPYYIDKELVDIYRDGLVKRWNPTQVVHELCSQSQWQPPSFVQHDYSLEKGYHFGVSVKDCHFVPVDRGANKKLAKHYASTFFLHFLGFKFRFNDIEKLPLISTGHYSNHNKGTYYRPMKINDNWESRNYNKGYKIMKRKYI